jgi:hypothetical protein
MHPEAPPCRCGSTKGTTTTRTCRLCATAAHKRYAFQKQLPPKSPIRRRHRKPFFEDLASGTKRLAHSRVDELGDARLG